MATLFSAESSPSRQRKFMMLRSGRCLTQIMKFAVFIALQYFYVKFINHFSDMSAALTYLLRKSQPQAFMMAPTCIEAFEILELGLISAPCLVLPKVSSDATFTVATNASAVGASIALLQDNGGGLRQVCYWARKLNKVERGNSYSAYGL
jgi:hypothetical protein